jgi:hypothetical protein
MASDPKDFRTTDQFEDATCIIRVLSAVLTQLIDINQKVTIRLCGMNSRPLFSLTVEHSTTFCDKIPIFLRSKYYNSSVSREVLPLLLVFLHSPSLLCPLPLRINKYAKCSPNCFIVALIYIDRLIEIRNIVLTSLNVHRILITRCPPALPLLFPVRSLTCPSVCLSSQYPAFDKSL